MNRLSPNMDKKSNGAPGAVLTWSAFGSVLHSKVIFCYDASLDVMQEEEGQAGLC